MTHISIITPSYNMASWLNSCISSVADQECVQLEHIIQDACSTDGTREILAREPRVLARIEKDRGMWDAINRGMRRSTGDIIGQLNCDEQYLPGALNMVSNFFSSNPSIDVLFGDALIVDPLGQLLCYQKAVPPKKYHIMLSHLPTLTCSTFFRRSVIDKHNLYFRDNLKAIADAYWVLDMLRLEMPFAIMHQFTSVYADTGENMNLKPNTRREVRELFEQVPLRIMWLKAFFKFYHRLKKLSSGCYCQKPFYYDIYTLDSPKKRKRFFAEKPSGVWRGKL